MTTIQTRFGRSDNHSGTGSVPIWWVAGSRERKDIWVPLSCVKMAPPQAHEHPLVTSVALILLLTISNPHRGRRLSITPMGVPMPYLSQIQFAVVRYSQFDLKLLEQFVILVNHNGISKLGVSSKWLVSSVRSSAKRHLLG